MSFLSNRRKFLKRATVASVGASVAGWLGPVAGADDAAPLFQISLAEWSLHRTIRRGELDHLDYAKYAKIEFGIDAVEYVNQLFADKANDSDYLSEMKNRAADHGVKSLLIMIDREGNLGHPDDARRRQAVENHYKWVEAAKFLGCHSIRVNAASGGTYDEQLERAADGLRRLSQFALQHGINVIVENHGGLSSNGKWLAAVIQKVELPNCGTLPDFGNFQLGDGKSYDRYQGVRELMPYAKAVSAKSHEFDDKGNEVRTDYLRMMKIVLDAGYRGYVGIEYEGRQLSEPEGIHATLRLLQRVRDQLSA